MIRRDDFPDLPDAACKLGALTEAHGRASDRVFFPRVLPGRPGHNPRIDTSTQAKAVCRTCPERGACAEWVIAREVATGELEHGVWGGLSQHDRKKLHGKRIKGDDAA